MEGVAQFLRFAGENDPFRFQGIAQGRWKFDSGERGVNTRTGMAIGIFQLRLGEGCAGARAPMHRFQAAINVPFQHHVAEDSDLSGFVFLLKTEVWLIPVSPDSPALKAFHLAVHLLLGVSSSLFAQLDRSQRLSLLLIHRLQHFQFDR